VAINIQTNLGISLFKSRKENSPEGHVAGSPIPISAIDLSKRYDLYCHSFEGDVVYEDARILGIRHFEQKKQFASALIGGYLELEFADGTRVLVSHHRIHMMCEHGSQPKYRVLRSRKLDKGE